MPKKCINGLDSLLEEGIPKNSTVLIEGEPGTLKSGFAFGLVSDILASAPKEIGVYVTLEQPVDSHMKNIEKMGMKKPGRLEVVDFSGIRKKYKEIEEKLNMVKIIEETIQYHKRENGKNFTLFVLDSLNALRSFATEGDRREFYHFFNLLRENELTSFIVVESTPLSAREYSSGYFLADGIIELGVLEKQENVTRYIQIKKMRERKHSMKKHRISLDKNGISILGPVHE